MLPERLDISSSLAAVLLTRIRRVDNVHRLVRTVNCGCDSWRAGKEMSIGASNNIRSARACVYRVCCAHLVCAVGICMSRRCDDQLRRDGCSDRYW